MALLQFTCNVIVTNVLLVAANTFAKKPKWNLFKPKNIITCRESILPAPSLWRQCQWQSGGNALLVTIIGNISY